MWRDVSRIVVVAVLLCTLAACSEPDGEHRIEWPDTATCSIAYLKSLYHTQPHLITEDLTIHGTVVTSDRMGNFYKSFVVQDASAGIEVKVDQLKLFEYLRAGSRVSIHCNSLTLGALSGNVQLGAAPSGGFETGYIAPNQIWNHIRVDTLAADCVTPHPVMRLSEITASMIMCRIRVSNVEFVEAECGMTWCDAGIATDRHLVDRYGDTLHVHTWPHALFADERMPVGSGIIEGVLDTSAGEYRLRVVDPYDLSMDGKRF